MSDCQVCTPLLCEVDFRQSACVPLRSYQSTFTNHVDFQVRIGSLGDPDDLPGLAHFTEHMLFYASEKYPLEDEYSKFVVSTPSNEAVAASCVLQYCATVSHSSLTKLHSIYTHMHATLYAFHMHASRPSRRLYSEIGALYMDAL